MAPLAPVAKPLSFSLRAVGPWFSSAAAHDDVVDRDEDQLHGVSNEAHDGETNGTGHRDLLELLGIRLGASLNQTARVHAKLNGTLHAVANWVVLVGQEGRHSRQLGGHCFFSLAINKQDAAKPEIYCYLEPNAKVTGSYRFVSLTDLKWQTPESPCKADAEMIKFSHSTLAQPALLGKKWPCSQSFAQNVLADMFWTHHGACIAITAGLEATLTFNV